MRIRQWVMCIDESSRLSLKLLVGNIRAGKDLEMVMVKYIYIYINVVFINSMCLRKVANNRNVYE